MLQCPHTACLLCFLHCAENLKELIVLCVFCIRAEHILRLVNQQQPVLSSAEKKLMHDMNEFKDKLKRYQKDLEQVKAKQNYHKVQVHDITSISVYMSDL